eukprot:m.48527 g.48527  ORF g.48527 m.48527 type:complete len:197 (+) comp11046_c0_seq2:2-592(+)
MYGCMYACLTALQFPRLSSSSAFTPTAQEYKREVNEAGEGIWVIVFLYKNELIVCRRLQQILAGLAAKYAEVKFVQSISTSCIPNYPDRNLPSLFIYCNDDLKSQHIGPGIFGGEAMTPEGVEWSLSQSGAFETDLEDPREASVQQALHQARTGGEPSTSPASASAASSAPKRTFITRKDRRQRADSSSSSSSDSD